MHHQLHGLHRLAAGLRRVEGRAAAREEQPRVREAAIGGDSAQPLGLGSDRRAGLLSGRHGAVYSIAPVSTFERHVLPNGLRILTASMEQAQSVSCFVMLAAGSRYETAESNGIAHFAEHMFFK